MFILGIKTGKETEKGFILFFCSVCFSSSNLDPNRTELQSFTKIIMHRGIEYMYKWDLLYSARSFLL